MQVDFRGRASLGRRHDNLVSELVTGPAKVRNRRSNKGSRRKKQSPPGRWKIYRKVGLRSSHNVLCVDKDADWTILASRDGEYTKEDCVKIRGRRVQLGVRNGQRRQ